MITIDGRALLDRSPGGIPTATRALLGGLACQGAEATVVFSTRRKAIPDVSLPSVVVQRSNRFQLIRHALGMGESFDRMVERALGVRPSVVFAPTLQPIRVVRSPLVLVVHDCSFLRFPEWLSGKDRWWHRLLRPRAVIESATRIICPSEFTKAELAHFFPHIASRVTVIPWGAPSPLRGNYQLPITNYQFPYVLSIGSHHKRKNPALICELRAFLATMNPSHELAIIDPTRPVTEQEKWSMLHHARALIYPSFYEGFGFPPLEAFAVGVPVVASCAGAIPEVVGDAGLLVEPYAMAQWKAALATVLTDEALRTRLIARGKERLEQFSWERCANDVVKVLRNIA